MKVVRALRRRGIGRWLPPAAAHGIKNWFVRRPAPMHVLFALVDHFEPHRGGVPGEVAAERLNAWLTRYPDIAARHRDADGRPPQHTWFYPWDEWHEGDLGALGQLVYDGLGEIELHLHHRDDTSASLRGKLTDALAAFGRYGALLSGEAAPQPRFGFIHGNWTLDNSGPDGDWCGVNDELRLLADTGCYADFTLPTPNSTQPRRVNVVYRATDDPLRPKSHDWGPQLIAGRRVPGDLLLIPGPLGINLRDWHHRWYPAIEQAEIAAPSPVSRARVDFWVRCGIGVRGRRDWVFVKCHTHGCVERDQDEVLGAGRERLHQLLEQRFNDGRRFALHYCTARELANLALAAEAGHGGDPNDWRDYAIPPPANALLRSATPVGIRALSPERGEIRHLSEGDADWRLKVGPVARVSGPVQALSWQGDQVRVDGDGVRVERR